MQADPTLTRRQLLARSGISLASMALATMHARGSNASSSLELHHPARAKRVIFLFMVGGPSQLDLFDPKPELLKQDGQPLPESILQATKFAQITEKQPRILGSRWKFARHGESGAPVSELLPATAKIADRLAFLRAIKTDDVNHALAELQLNTGWKRAGRPSLGSWLLYGLGSEAESLPGFVVLQSGMPPRAKSGNYSNGFLSTTYHGVPLRSAGEPILHLRSPEGFTEQRQRRTIEAVRQLNRLHQKATLDSEIDARIADYETAFRMQMEAPQVFELGTESAATLAQYGIDNVAQPSFARNCLLARRLVEQGVRFVQLFHGDWDHHSNIGHSLPALCRQVDQASAALVDDLAQRGLLEDTLVIWGGEFGRGSVAQVAKDTAVGRDHHIEAFPMWFAGGGVQAGRSIGATDDFGHFAVEDPCHIHDVQATILHLLGLDHTRLTFRTQGRDFRLTDVHGRVLTKLFS
jgi:uncharacterized protein (DUF1501 family)